MATVLVLVLTESLSLVPWPWHPQFQFFPFVFGGGPTPPQHSLPKAAARTKLGQSQAVSGGFGSAQLLREPKPSQDGPKLG